VRLSSDNDSRITGLEGNCNKTSEGVKKNRAIRIELNLVAVRSFRSLGIGEL